MPSKNAKELHLAVPSIALQAASWFVLGILCDVVSPQLAVIVPTVVPPVLAMLSHVNVTGVPSDLISYLSYMTSGLLGKLTFLLFLFSAGYLQR